MKPLNLKLKAFGPYLQPQEVDFSSLFDSGLFLMCGDTGSGKTVILDAIVFALYGKSSGGDRGDISEMRCKMADDKAITEVEYIFELKGKQYKFTRTLQIRTKRNGEKEMKSQQNVLFLNNEMQFEPFFQNPKIKDVEQKAVELLGLTHEQFCQIIILPQGKFERFLVADSSDKEKILVSLFGVQKWDLIVKNMKESLEDTKRKLESDEIKIGSILTQTSCKTLDEIDEKAISINNEILQLSTKKDEISVKQSSLNSLYEKEKKLSEQFDTLNDATLKHSLLLKQEDEILSLKTKLNSCEKANLIMPIYDQFVSSKENLKLRKSELYKANENRLISKESLSAITKRQDDLLNKKELFDEKRLELQNLIGLRDTYKRYSEAELNVIDSEKKLNSKKADCNKQDEKTKAVQRLRVGKVQLVADLGVEYSNLLNKFRTSMGGQLAGTLIENQPCPVCGSKSHPNPATLCENDVTWEMLESKEKQRKLADKAAESAKQSYEEEKEKYDQQLIEKERLSVFLINAQQNLELCKKSIKSDISDSRQLESKIHQISDEINTYDKACNNVKTEVTNAQQDLYVIDASILTCEKELSTATAQFDSISGEFNEKMIASSFNNAEEIQAAAATEKEIKTIKERCEKFDKDKAILEAKISETKALIDEKEKPDILKLKEQLTAVESEMRELVADTTRLEYQLKDIKIAKSKLSKIMLDFSAEKEKYEKNMDFLKKVRGDKGLSLQRYVLGVMLSAITNETNKLLSKVLEGKYRLFRTTDAISKNKKFGLELEIYNNNDNSFRKVSTLSGGEKFLISLALSIGLSVVVQAQSGGISLETMFVDEGFGTLDEKCIGDALSILMYIKESHGLVGIISHLEILKNNISTKISVTKGKKGSTLKVIL